MSGIFTVFHITTANDAMGHKKMPESKKNTAELHF